MKIKICKDRGFTLLEIMLVVTIIVLLLGAAIYYMGGDVGVAQGVRVKADISAITTELKIYQGMNGFLPTTEQGLQALVTRPQSDPKPTQWHNLMDQIPTDPWGTPYQYENPVKHNPDSYDLYSTGGGKQGAEMGNWSESGSK